MKILSILLLVAATAHAELSVKVLPVKVTGQKVIVPFAMKNNFSDKVESARAAVFLLDEAGRRIGQGTRWVIGGTADKPGLAAGATNTFFFVVTTEKPFTTTNLTPQIIFSRVILEGGKQVDAAKEVSVTPVKN